MSIAVFMNEMEIDHIPDDDELAGLPESQRIVTKILEVGLSFFYATH